MLLNHFLFGSIFLDDDGPRPLGTCSLASCRQQMFYSVTMVFLCAASCQYRCICALASHTGQGCGSVRQSCNHSSAAVLHLPRGGSIPGGNENIRETRKESHQLSLHKQRWLQQVVVVVFEKETLG